MKVVARHKQHRLAPIWAAMRNETPVLAWRWRGRFDAAFVVALDGEVYSTTRDREAILPAALVGAVVRIDVLATSRWRAATLDWSVPLARPRCGQRLELAWTPVDLDAVPDFVAYRLYWDGGEGGDPQELLAELYGADSTRYRTPPLDEGTTYRFALALVDAVGNESERGAVATGRVQRRPLAPVNASIAYNPTTRRATVAAQAPAGQHADVRAYHLYWSDDYGACERACLDRPRARWRPSSSLTWTTPPLYAGEHRFELRAVDGAGNESEPASLAIALAYEDGDLVAVSQRPAPPTLVRAWPAPQGRVRARIELAEPSAVDSVRLYSDDALVAEAATGGAAQIVVESEPLADSEHTIEATAVAGGRESARSEAVIVATDDDAPSGNRTLTVELVR